MSVPVIGAVMTAALLTCDLRDCFRLPLTPSPLSLVGSGDSEGSSSSSGDSNGTDEPGGFSNEVRLMWPSVSHAGGGFSPRALQAFLQQPEGSVLSDGR